MIRSLAYLLIMILVSCGPTAEVGNTEFKESTAHRVNPFLYTDALQIVGAPIMFTKCDTTRTGTRLTFYSEFTSTKPDSLGRTAVVYYIYNEYANPDSAVYFYNKFHRENFDHGVQELRSVGDAAYVHTDTTNFYYGMIVKGNKEVRIKLNKIVVTSRREDFLAVMNRIGLLL